jgi:transcriptional antiterminator Rof (Rho-off)
MHVRGGELSFITLRLLAAALRLLHINNSRALVTRAIFLHKKKREEYMVVKDFNESILLYLNFSLFS